MFEKNTIPTDLISKIGLEESDFVVKTNRATPLSRSIGLIIAGIFWMSVIGAFAYFLRDHDDVQKIIYVFGFFVGVIFLYGGLVHLFLKGGYFAGTPTRLIFYNYQYKKLQSLEWKYFSKNIEVRGNKNKGDLTLTVKQNIALQKDSEGRYIPIEIEIVGVDNPFEIEKMCSQRISAV